MSSVIFLKNKKLKKLIKKTFLRTCLEASTKSIKDETQSQYFLFLQIKNSFEESCLCDFATVSAQQAC